MTALNETAAIKRIPVTEGKRRSDSLFTRLLKFSSSVPFGVFLLIVLGAACLVGMLVMQQNVEGFANYFATLTPAQKLVYGRLGFFDIYHAWYFNALLSILSLNIVLATIDRFPKIWPYFSKPSISVPVRWLKEQKHVSTFSANGNPETLAATIAGAMKASGFRDPLISEKNGRTYVFAESGRWNRLAFCAVHLALLTIFLGGFLTSQLGHTGSLPLAPGQSSNLMYDTAFELDNVTEVTKQLPFEVTFTDMQQKLIRDDGSLSPGNTIDWMTWFTIKDADGTHDAFVQMNRPFDYRGYRFFQSSFTPIGRARTIDLVVTAENGGAVKEITIPRNGSAQLDDGTKIVFAEFRGNFRLGPEDPNEDTSRYENPAAVLEVFPVGGVMQQATAFGPDRANIPIANKAIGGYTFQLAGFEKVADSHVLSVQYDPGANVVYVGFAMLFLTLVAVFMVSHRRVWVVVEKGRDDSSEIIIAGNTNRNLNSFDERFRRLEVAVRKRLEGEKPE